MISDQLGLVTHLPEVGTAETTGYHAVGSGLFLLVLTLLFVGMLGLYARWSGPDGPTVIEYGDGYARYVLVEFSEKGLHRANGSEASPADGGPRGPGETGLQTGTRAGPARSKHRPRRFARRSDDGTSRGVRR